MKRKLGKKALTITIITIAACAALGTGLGVKTYRHNETVKAEAAAEEKEYADLTKSYADAEKKIKYSIFEDDTNKGNKDAQDAARKAESDKLLKYKAKIEGKSMTDADKKAFKSLLKEIKSKYDDSNQLVSEVSQSVLSEDTASLGTYYTDDMKTADAASKEAYEKAMKEGNYQAAMDALNQMNNNIITASTNKSDAEKKAAEEAAAKAAAEQQAAAQQAQAEADAKKSASSKQSAGKGTGSSRSSRQSASAGSSQRSTQSASTQQSGGQQSGGQSSSSSGKDWKHSPIDYNHFYTPEECPDGYHVLLHSMYDGFPYKGSGMTREGANAFVQKWPSWKITTGPNGNPAVCYAPNGLDANGVPVGGYYGVTYIVD